MSASKKSLSGSLLVALLIAFMLAEGAYRLGALATVEHLYSDLWHRLSGVRYTPQHVALVVVDDQSLAKYSDDPLVFWTPLFARSIETLHRVGVAVIGVDFLFASTAEKWISRLESTATEKLRNYDLPFRQQLGSGQVVLVASLIKGLAGQQDSLLLPHQDYLLALPDFDLLSHIGYADFLPDPDGAIRRYQNVPKLNLAAGLSEGAPRFTLAALLAGLASGQPIIQAEANISYAGPPGSIAKIPISRLLAADALHDPMLRALSGKVVIIGGDFFGMNDVHATPYSGGSNGRLMTGAEIEANIVETLLSGKTTETVPSWVRWLVFAGMIALSLLAYRRLSPWAGLAILAGAVFVSLLMSLALFKWSYLFPAAHLQFGLLLAYTLSYGNRLTSEQRQKDRIRRMFGRYVSDSVVEVLLESDHLPDLGGESVSITVLFSDIRDFTAISEKLSAHEVMELLNHYFERACEPILANGGTIDKFIGDTIMVQFGAPLHYPDHAEKALRTAIAMRQVAGEFRQWMKQRFADRNLPEFNIGIGIHSGEAVVGNVGCGKRIEYTAVGDTVNLASRLESACKTLGCEIVVSSDTLKAAGNVVETGKHELIQVKGRQMLVEAYEVLGLKERKD